MPRGDGTGPFGMGPMTGRAAGFCAGFGTPGYLNPGCGPGFSPGMGRGGRGRRNRFIATGLAGWQRAAYGYPYGGAAPEYGPVPFSMAPEQEIDMLKKQSEHLEKTLAELNQRIQELESEGKKKS